jgi:hypothetical protein
VVEDGIRNRHREYRVIGEPALWGKQGELFGFDIVTFVDRTDDVTSDRAKHRGDFQVKVMTGSILAQDRGILGEKAIALAGGNQCRVWAMRTSPLNLIAPLGGFWRELRL